MKIVFDFTLPVFVIVYGTTGMTHLKTKLHILIILYTYNFLRGDNAAFGANLNSNFLSSFLCYEICVLKRSISRIYRRKHIIYV
jgi:hypothetical protein